MRIENLGKRIDGDTARVSMRVAWEDCGREACEAHFDTPAQFEQDFEPSANAFMLATFAPAMYNRERRVLVEGKVCPRLRNGLQLAQQIMCDWYRNDGYKPVEIEATEGFEAGTPRPDTHTGSLLSGGIDALSMLRTNHLDYPPDHPQRIKTGLFIHGFDVGGYKDENHNRDNSRTAIDYLTKLAGDQGVTLLPVWTNLRHVDDRDDLFYRMFYGAALASIAHLFTRRLSTIFIATGSCANDLEPLGSHPLLDPNYSSCSLEVRHEGVRFSRFEKVGIVAQWEEALAGLRSCYDPFRSAERLNCGSCEKCLRTMTALVMHGKLQDSPTYPHDDVTPEMLEAIISVPPPVKPDNREELINIYTHRIGWANVYYWHEMAGPLRQMGRADLADVVDRKLKEHHAYLNRIHGRHFRGRVKRRLKRLVGMPTK